jgi:hypothetical protein
MVGAACTELVEFSNNECKRQPSFLSKWGISPSKAAFSTSEKTIMGLVLLELQQSGPAKKVQHPTWRMGGWLGPILISPDGHCFVAPVPVVNVLNNPPESQNTIYRVDGNSGEMKVFAKLPLSDTIHPTNPYGILGFAYLCETNTLYVSTVQGSDRKTQRGIIYALNAKTGEIIDQIRGVDVLGMGISYMPGYRALYLGSARSSDVWEVKLSAKGTFSGRMHLAFTLSMLGPRGDDKVRRIRFNQYGAMQIYGVEFNFNLTAPTEKQETVYTFQWNENEARWVYQLQ